MSRCNSSDLTIMLCFFYGIYTVDYRDQFLFFNAGKFLSPQKILGTFIIDQSPTFFLWWKADQYNQENRKRKKYHAWLCHLFYPPYFFFSFVITCSLFFILASVCRPNIRESILRGIHTLPFI
jgi:hypothetical protein